MRIVVVVATVLEIPSNVNVPPGEPPIYPTDLEPEQPEQDCTLAPLATTFEEDSASGVVSEGPALQVPLLMERIQFTSLCYFFFFISTLSVFRKSWAEEVSYKCSSRP